LSVDTSLNAICLEECFIVAIYIGIAEHIFSEYLKRLNILIVTSLSCFQDSRIIFPTFQSLTLVIKSEFSECSITIIPLANMLAQ
jgi:hypothetical protein